jgi:uridine kinase
MQNNATYLTKIHREAVQTILTKLNPILEERKKTIITVSGEVASGKTPTSLSLGRELKQQGYAVKIIDLDNFYLVHPLKRRAWREKHGIDKVGVSEIDWKTLENVIEAFMEGRSISFPYVDLLTDQVDTLSTTFEGIDILIIHGLYSMHIDASDLRIFMEMTWPETLDRQRESMKEVIDEHRLKVLRREQEVVQDLKKNADIYIDLNTALEIFHL